MITFSPCGGNVITVDTGQNELKTWKLCQESLTLEFIQSTKLQEKPLL